MIYSITIFDNSSYAGLIKLIKPYKTPTRLDAVNTQEIYDNKLSLWEGLQEDDPIQALGLSLKYVIIHSLTTYP